MTTLIEGNRLIRKFMHHAYPFKYNESWSELMPVVEKIESLGYRTQLNYDEIQGNWFKITEGHSYQKALGESKSKIKAVWLAVVEFIKWYNQNK